MNQFAPGRGNPNTEGINQIQRDFIIGCPNIWLHREKKSYVFPFDVWVDPTKGNDFRKVRIKLQYSSYKAKYSYMYLTCIGQ